MCWFRIRRTFGVHATLFALLIQFVASFGHVHLGYVGPVTTAVAESILAADRDDAGSPLDGDSQPGSVCDVCATVNLTTFAQIALPPGLPTRSAFYVAALAPATETALATTRRVAFRSRAPPFA
jgi:hypothetical protein